MSTLMTRSFARNFLGNSPLWYKKTILLFLILNPIALHAFGPAVAGWMLVGEFIFTLAMALKCYPLLPGGLLAIEALAIGLTSTDALYVEVGNNLPVILLLMFMVAGIYFMKDLLLLLFTRLLLGVRSKSTLSLLFCSSAALLSAFLDALTVTAVIIAVAMGFYRIYHKAASAEGVKEHGPYSLTNDHAAEQLHPKDLEQFRSFLRSLMMHGVVGTALGGVMTMVGEPQNLLIAKTVGWSFSEFFLVMLPISAPVFLAGLLTCLALEKTRRFGYGARLPSSVRAILKAKDQDKRSNRTSDDVAALWVQAFAAVALVLGLAFHVAEVGLVGLMIIVLVASMNGITNEQRIGKAFDESMPFASLLVVFFAVVAVIHEQHLFQPIIQFVLSKPESQQAGYFFVANGLLSMISDNVFVATVYITEIKQALDAGLVSREHFELLAVAINSGTNLPSVATPNGQAAFLFLLTSAIAPLIRLSYGRMVMMALPYTVVMGLIGFFCVKTM
jgi:NhaB family Na+:H+ antiporter